MSRSKSMGAEKAGAQVRRRRIADNRRITLVIHAKMGGVFGEKPSPLPSPGVPGEGEGENIRSDAEEFGSDGFVGEKLLQSIKRVLGGAVVAEEAHVVFVFIDVEAFDGFAVGVEV